MALPMAVTSNEVFMELPGARTQGHRGKRVTYQEPSAGGRQPASALAYAVAFTEIIEFAQKRLPKREAYERGIRRAVEIYPRDAVREIIANALIHQDFTIGGTGPIIEIYTDRLEVTNPGNSLVAIDRIIDERRSRNERLASAMRSLGMCEERGGGIDKAIVQIEEAALPAPWFDFSQNNMIVTLFGPKQFKDLTTVDKTWSCFCHCVIRFIRKDYMTNSSLRKRFGVADYQITSNIISRTIREGKIVPADPNQGRRFARYVPYWAR
jgi:predicted HTH transcriptional regulator